MDLRPVQTIVCRSRIACVQRAAWYADVLRTKANAPYTLTALHGLSMMTCVVCIFDFFPDFSRWNRFGGTSEPTSPTPYPGVRQLPQQLPGSDHNARRKGSRCINRQLPMPRVEARLAKHKVFASIPKKTNNTHHSIRSHQCSGAWSTTQSWQR